jgi:tubulin-specific chaperone B
MNPMTAALRSYVTAQDDPSVPRHQKRSSSTIVLDEITHANLQQRHVEVRFHCQDSLSTLRQYVHRTTGTPPDDQHLQFYINHEFYCEIKPSNNDEHRPLGYFIPECASFLRLHVIDINPHSISRQGALEDTSLVPKYVMTDAEYHARSNTLRSWVRQQQEHDPDFSLASYATQHQALMAARQLYKHGLPLPPGFHYDTVAQQVVAAAYNNAEDDELIQDSEPAPTNDAESIYGIASIRHCQPNGNDAQSPLRCEVQPGGRRGTVEYVGLVPELGPDYWVGVVLDEPTGRHHGTIQGRTYFTCPPNHGVMVRGAHVTVGDFPVRQEWDDDDDEL